MASKTVKRGRAAARPLFALRSLVAGALVAALCGVTAPSALADQGRGDHRKRAHESIVAQAILTERTHPLHALVGLMTRFSDCEGFDEVAPDVFAAWWADKGARVGRRRGNEIVWANGDVTAIPAFAHRWEGDTL